MNSNSSRRLCAAVAGIVVSFSLVSVSAAASASHSRAAAARPAAAGSGAGLFSRSAWQNARIGNLDPAVLDLALDAAASAVERHLVSAPSSLTVIDYSKPSTERRLWVFDVRSHALLFDELVAHGRGSGTQMATRFSNADGSDESSLGLFRTAEPYLGHNGYSLRLDGLEPGVNDHARGRAIVVHGAWYVSATLAKAQGYIGRSLGCPAVRPEIVHALIDTIKDGGLVFAYYPDQSWLRTSTFLN